MTIFLILIGFSLLLLLLIRYAYGRHPKFPPGPPRIPIWGSYVQLLLENYNCLYTTLNDMNKRYNSKILGMYFGSVPLVVVSDYDAIKEVLVRPEFQGRIPNTMTKHRSFGRDIGVFFMEGPEWLEQRRFALRHMRDFGFGRRSDKLENLFLREITDVFDVMRGMVPDKEVCRDGAVLIPYLLVPPFINALMLVFAGEGFPRSWDPVLRGIARNGFLFQKSCDTTGGFLTIHPWLSWMAPKLCGFKDATTGTAHMRNFLKKSLIWHQTTYSEELMRDFFDIYIKELKCKDSTIKSTFSDEQLLMTALDFFFPTATAVTSTLQFAILDLIYHPHVCRKMQQELDTVVGRDRLPTLDDRPSLPYTEAALRETMRFHTLAPISVGHRATEDTYLNGYFIPKNTAVLTALWSMHMDESLWGDPEIYRPERFLEENGKLKKKDYTLPFGAGKRLCAGETFARQNMFVFFASLFQNFNFELSEKSQHITLKHNIPGLIETLPDMWVKPIPRT